MKPWSVLVTIGVVAYGGPCLAEEIFISSHNDVSNRFAVLEDDERVAYLYLTARGTQRPERDAIAYVRNAPPETVDWKAAASEGNPPMLDRAHATMAAVIPAPIASDFSVRWSPDGESAALLYKGDPIALVLASERMGYSKAVASECPLARPWDEALFVRAMGK
jgi:hypothetical protein